jgi:hypothetical protein
MIEDILLSLASMGFIFADIKQAHKLFMNSEYDTCAFSKTHFRLKLLSLATVSVAYYLLSTHIALTIALIQFGINIYILKKIGGLK